MTDSMNFGPDWIRNLSSEGTTTGGSSGVPKYQLAEFRYGREEMLALFDKTSKPPQSLMAFKGLYSETTLLPLALMPTTEEDRAWQSRPVSVLGGPTRGRGGPLDRGGRVSRGGRGGYQNYGRPVSAYDGGWNTTGEQTEWSPRKDYNMRSANDNWRRKITGDDEGESWRGSTQHTRPTHEKWGRSSSWRGGDGDLEERQGNPMAGRANSTQHAGGWTYNRSHNPMKKSWDNEDHLPEWATENVDGGGTFDSSGAFHNSDEEQQSDTKQVKRETVLQKSTSQQHITPKKGDFAVLQTSKSVASLSKIPNNPNKMKEKPDENGMETQYNENDVPIMEKPQVKRQQISDDHKIENAIIEQQMDNGNVSLSMSSPSPIRKKELTMRVDDDFKIQEDIMKLVDDEMPKTQNVVTQSTTTNELSANHIQPPPNLGPPMPDQWFYQDPQGQMQGPFSGTEMAEWYKAGYFNGQLKVRRPCDELFHLLGELVTLCDGANPFLSGKRFPALKPDPSTLPEPELLQYQYLMALRQGQNRMSEPWNATLSLQQQEAAAQRLMMNPQVTQDLTFLHQHQSKAAAAAANPLMHMINQMQQQQQQQQSDKVPNQLDPRLVQLTNLQYQNRLPPTSTIPNPLTSRLPGLTEGLNLPGVMASHPLGLAPNIVNSMNLQRPMGAHNTVVDNMVNAKPPEDPISSLLKQLQQQKQQQQQQGVTLDSFWQTGNQFPVTSAQQQQWQQNEPPISMWDLTKSDLSQMQQHQQQQQQQQQQQDLSQPNHNKLEGSSIIANEILEQKAKKPEATTAKELKKKKEQEEKQAKKEADEKRKSEQRKLEAEKKAIEDKKKKEEERIKKEIEKAKKEAEEKRLKELEEKRKLKEQRKAEEESRKKLDEQKKAEEDRAKREAREREENVKRETARLVQEQAIRNSKIAPWSQSSSAQGPSLQEIQKLEREKARQEAAVLQQLKQMQDIQRQQEEKAASSFTWANKAKENRTVVKSLAEIQAEEQERLARQTAEARLLALQKEKEQPQVQNSPLNIWNSQNLSWSANSSNSSNTQWSSNTNSAGLWEDTPGKPQQQQQQSLQVKPSTNSKNANQAATAAKPQNVQQKSKAKNLQKAGGNNQVDAFTEWCCKTLSNINSQIDIPTFVTFLRDIESALDVREYCKDYLGENVQAQQFATQFLEKRRSFKPKNQAPKDDMCSPAPAITPSLHNNNEFQEVKGKNKKNKKNKMLKVDNRILGFNVTSAPDRINVGDRDYGDNS